MKTCAISIIILFKLFAIIFTFYSLNLQANIKVTDGPYIDVEPKHMNVSWICDDQVSKENHPLATKEAPHSLNYCGLSAQVEQTTFKDDPIIFETKEKIAALSDLHGQYHLMKTLLKNNGILDRKDNWAFGKGHFVITGDIFDRGDQVTEILWLVHKIEQQALRAGGRVHLLLGNHEVMVLNGDLRYLNPKYIKTGEFLKVPFQKLIGKNTILGRWLRSKPVLLKINGYLFTHGGFHPSLAKQPLSLSDLNHIFKSYLVKGEPHQTRTGMARFLHKSNGLVWYRGYFKDNGATEKELELLLKHFDVDHVVVGHTSQRKIETRHNGKVIAIDSSIKKGKYGEILFIEDDNLYRGALDGERMPLK
ncbi:hypothetical protein N474_02670 [Pseudoalteromonas luteoviolacea CPMOR-2]|uniref:Calcineurin-like phosphoesterase domain-containing protein n=1 Tax=Pseudoalteromonas luteoviolacea DSM 6061 TaxID=1365250 RepID=A0A166UVF7_9GAMM|nr:metallophosphoesterase [Pseudoalteromonas luteoviolacea]KZN30855.1 hypothetical protein N475_23845 [Pseudoalteromonas luteoviolacea DSM 6061]KZN53418.1 hypothetical protein N474_02670 [Pseudoalteromonas luteoviolacea CPMOR-2]MBE0386230.1 hypothetical protein [Pseudoalteromonas luteoviolacea DSM 6061]